MEIIIVIIIGFLKFTGYALMFPFISAVMFGTTQSNYDTWYKKFYFQWYPLGSLCLLSLVALIAAFYVIRSGK